MLQTPGQDDHDGDLELSIPGLDDPESTVGPTAGPGPEGAGAGPDEDDEADEDDCRPLDDSLEQVGYELFDWDPEDLDELDERLHELDLPHEWVSEGFEVVVHEADEATVDALLPTVRFPDELPAEADDGDDTSAEVLSALFVAADRLLTNPTGDAVTALLDAAERIGDEVPYGIDEGQWDPVVEAVDELIDLFHAAGPPAVIAETAGTLRNRLRPLV